MYPPPTDRDILAILAKHGFPAGPVETSPHEGSVNHVRMVGDVCVRVLKDEDFASDIYTEVVSVPAVREAGVAVPELLVFDDVRDIVPGLVTIYRRLPGVPLGEVDSVDDLDELVREIGRQIALWQHGVKRIEDPRDWLDKPQHYDLGQCFERNAERLTIEERAWTESAIRRLETAKEGPRAFVHWDLHAHNILVHEGRFVAVLDWGDAGWGDPTINVHCLPAAWLPLLLEPLGDVDVDYIGRCLYGILGYALNDIHRPPRPAGPIANIGHRRWQSLQSLSQQPLPEKWRHWLTTGPPVA